MTVVEVYRRDGVPCGIKVSGHSGFAEAGNDVVCAAVSVLVQTLYIGLTDVLSLSPSANVDEKSATIEFRWQPGAEELRVLAETIFRALSETARSYGNYVKYVEVSL